MLVLKFCVLTVFIFSAYGSVSFEKANADEIKISNDIEALRNNYEWNNFTNNISYVLYNRLTHGSRYFSFDTNISNFDRSVGTVILIDGHNAYFDARFRTEVSQVMDWTDLSFSYTTALLNMEEAADDLVKFLNLLQFSKGSDDLLDVHIVAFGVGAHLAGRAGSAFVRTNPIGRITGLDPTRREFRLHVLQRFDAKYVEIIHTNGIEPGGTGGFEMTGDVNFIPNGGLTQRGCLTSSCSHNRSWQLFLSSLQFDHLIGRKCDSVTQVFCLGPTLNLGGVEISKDPMVPGIYRLNTRLTFPF